MRRVSKVTISLPIDLLQDVERYQKRRGESRSETVARLLAAALRRDREEADIERYIRGYLEQPETPEEIAAIDLQSQEAALSDPWP